MVSVVSLAKRRIHADARLPIRSATSDPPLPYNALRPAAPTVSPRADAEIHRPSSCSFCLILLRRALASSLLFAARFCRCVHRHSFTLRFASLHMPADLYRNPRAWHSSRALMTAMQALKGGRWLSEIAGS